MKLNFLVIVNCFLTGALCISSVHSNGQCFSKQIDCDSNNEFGTSIAITRSGEYLVVDGFYYPKIAQHTIGLMTISRNGVLIKQKNYYFPPVANSVYTVGSNGGGYGRLCVLNDSNYLLPMIKEYSIGRGYSQSEAGLMMIDATGTTMLTAYFTDTSMASENSNSVAYNARLQQYIIGGVTCPKPPHDSFINVKGLLIIADNSGHMIVRKEFEKKAPIPPLPPNGVTSRINSVESLPGGRILIGATNGNLDSKYGPVGPVHLDYYHMRPWFIITDASGNILKDTMYDGHFSGQGNVNADKLEGYLHWGVLDSFLYDNPIDYRNQPGYVAHLDSNFKPIWLHMFGGPSNKVYVIKTIQLSNGDYFAMGECTTALGWYGWASRLSHTGQVKWERNYAVDITTIPYLVDAKERSDKSIVLVGMARNTSNPAWRQQDIWLLSIDSNGCELPECSYPTNVPNEPVAETVFKLYPNPTNGVFYTEAAESGKLTLFNMQGSRAAAYSVVKGKQELHLSAALSAGIYIGQYNAMDGKAMQTIRIIYRP